MENSLDNVCSRFIYFELSAIKPKPPRGFTGIEFAAFHPALIAPSHIIRDGLALFLCEGSVDGGDEFTTHIDSIDAFTLETDVDTQLFQFTDILKAVLGVAGKAGDRFDKDLIDQTRRQSAIIRWKSSRLVTEVPVIPSSA